MLRSYLILAWKVLLRRKFFTAISLFGISFTLMILLVVVAFFDHVNGPHTPEKRIDQMLFITTIRQQFQHGNGWMNTPASSSFVDRYVRPLTTPEKVGIISTTENATAFANNKSLKLDLRYTDASFWEIMNFDFLEGRPFTAPEVKSAARTAVINEHTARAYFGTHQGVVGREMEINLTRYRVSGVVRDVPAIRMFSYSEVWVPYTLSASDFRDTRFSGQFLTILLAPSRAAVPAMQTEFNQMTKRIKIPNPKDIEHVYVYADPLVASFTRQLSNTPTSDNDNLGTFYLICAVLGLFFMTLPALNLVNLNVTRILERSSEIGVRKAFGASGNTLVMQFLIENIALALIGGLIGLALAATALHLLNDSQVIAYSQFSLNWRVFAWGMLLTVFFGILSGVYPAWKMSRLNPITALRGQAA